MISEETWAYARKVAATIPHPPPELARRLRALLHPPREGRAAKYRNGPPAEPFRIGPGQRT